MKPTVGSILHGAYGDYYEQMIALRWFKKMNPDQRLVIFFATESRRKELAVFDTSFADEVYPAQAITEIPVDRFLQFQIRDSELRADILDRLPAEIRSKFDFETINKPWTWIRKVWRRDPSLCDVGLSAAGKEALPSCMEQNDVSEELLRNKFTVGFLWRYRITNQYIAPAGQPPEEVVRSTKGALLQHFVDHFGATVLIAGMNLKVDDSNRERTDCKFSQLKLPVNGDCRYLKGLSWGLELEIMRRCRLCFVMASGFSEALWFKRGGRDTFLVDPPRSYLLKLMYNRMPMFGVRRPQNWLHYFVRSHSPETILRYARRRSKIQGQTNPTQSISSPQTSAAG